MRAVNTRMKLPQNGFKKTHTLEIAPHFLCILSLLCTVHGCMFLMSHLMVSCQHSYKLFAV